MTMDRSRAIAARRRNYRNFHFVYWEFFMIRK